MARLRVAVLMGGPSSEHEVSLVSGANVLKHISSKKYLVVPVKISRENRWSFPKQRPVSVQRGIERLQRFDVAFLALHGQFGEDGVIQAMLEANQIAFTGSGSAASALAMDKHLSNLLFQAAGFHVPVWGVAESGRPHPRIALPAVVKPVRAGSSVDTAVVRRRLREAVEHVVEKHLRVLVQQFVTGREITVGVLEEPRGTLRILPPTEIRPKTSTWFDYRAKYTVGGSEEITPAPLTATQTKQVQHLAAQAHTLLGCRGMSRSDFIFDGKRFWILETNTIPGLTPTSLLPQGAAAAAIPFSTMLDWMIRSGRQRFQLDAQRKAV